MRLQQRNLTTIYYCLYKSKTKIYDDDGYETSEEKIEYYAPVPLKCSVSPARGEAQLNTFGNLDSYDKVIITDDINCPIDENTVLYVDRLPSNIYAYDYTVKRVARSLNNIAIAISKVDVS